MKKIHRQYAIFFGIVLAILIFDQWTKNAIINAFSLGESISILENYFNITYVRNTGAAFGILATAPESFRVPFFFLIPTIALFMILYIFHKNGRDNPKLFLALALVFGGAIGNLVDRALYGYVIDFLDFHWRYQKHFPAFNVADSSITVGVGILLLDLFDQKGN